MAKILIWSLGTGGRINNGRTEYHKATYYRNDKSDTLSTPYIYDALEKFFDFDQCVIVGTAGSGWCSFYEHFFPDFDGIDEDYWEELRQMQEKGTHFDDDIAAVRAKLEQLKTTIGKKCAEIIVLKYGLNEDEMYFNFEAMAQIGNVIADGDSISFDITHSFRSLAFYEFLAVSYFKDVLRKNVKIEFVSYGMLEFSRENNGFTPILDLSSLVSMTDWLKSAEEYRRYGTTSLLVDNLNKDDHGIPFMKEEKKILRRLGAHAISTNDLSEFKKLVNSCIIITKGTTATKRRNVALDYIFKDIVKRFGNKLEDDMSLQTELALWHLEKKRYIAALITIVEATLDYCAKLSGHNKKVVRPLIRKKYSPNSDVRDFQAKYDTVRLIRNKLAHAESLTKQETDNLAHYIKDLYSTYVHRFKAMPENEAALRQTLQPTSPKDVG